MNEIVNNDAASFEQDVLRSDRPVVVDFWADWCGPCQRLAPALEDLARRHEDVKVAKVDVDNNSEIAGRYGILSIPTLMIFQNGKVVDQMVGTMPKKALVQRLEDQLQPA